MAQRSRTRLARFGDALLTMALAAVAGGAAAQSMSNGGSDFNGGYGRSAGQENQSVALSLVSRDENGNREIVNGVIQTASGSVQASASAAGSAYTGGVGGGGALAVGNSLTVITQGNYNTVIVDSTQINSGDINAYAGVGE